MLAYLQQIQDKMQYPRLHKRLHKQIRVLGLPNFPIQASCLNQPCQFRSLKPPLGLWDGSGHLQTEPEIIIMKRMASVLSIIRYHLLNTTSKSCLITLKVYFYIVLGGILETAFTHSRRLWQGIHRSSQPSWVSKCNFYV